MYPQGGMRKCVGDAYGIKRLRCRRSSCSYLSLASMRAHAQPCVVRSTGSSKFPFMERVSQRTKIL